MNPIDQYIDQFPESTQERLRLVRTLICRLEPEAAESISYGMPAYKLKDKALVYFAGYTNHIGLYALPFTHARFAEELKGYKQGKGSVQFPHTRPLPVELIEAMVRWRADEIRLKQNN